MIAYRVEATVREDNRSIHRECNEERRRQQQVTSECLSFIYYNSSDLQISQSVDFYI